MSTTPQIVQIQGGTYQDDLHLYRDPKGQERPSVTQIMDSCGLVDLANIPGDTLEAKRQLGDVVHYATRLHDLGDLDPYSVHPLAAEYLESYQDVQDEVGIECLPEWIEVPFIHTEHGMVYAGTIDRVCRFTKSQALRNKLIILELKCTYSEEPAWKIQMAGYECKVKKEFPKEEIVRVAAQLKPRDKKTLQKQPARLYMYQNPRDKDIFLTCLALTNWRINEGLPWRREK